MSTEPPNPPAFPLMGVGPEDGKPVEFHGMSIRDFFAAAALTGLLASESNQDGEYMGKGKPGACMAAYEIADQMLLERANQPSA